MDQWLSVAAEIQQLAWVRAIEVVLVAIVLARTIDRLVSRFVLPLTLRTGSVLDDQLVETLHRPVFVSVILVGLQIAVELLALRAGIEWVLIALIHTTAVFVWTAAGFRLSASTLGVLSRLADRATWLEPRSLPLFDNLSKILLFGLASYGFLVAWDLDLAPWLASAGIAGIAIGFAAKDSLANLFGGLFVIMDAPYKLGDFIHLDSGERGRVVQIGLRSTRLLTRDDIEITLPNSHIANSKIVNESGGPYEKTRVAITVGVAYGSEIERVRGVLLDAANSVDAVAADPAPRVRFVEMGDSALTFRVQGWVDEPARRGECIDGLNTAVYNALGRAGIEIPFPQRVVHAAPPSAG